jgi:hypothetical protein
VVPVEVVVPFHILQVEVALRVCAERAVMEQAEHTIVTQPKEHVKLPVVVEVQVVMQDVMLAL